MGIFSGVIAAVTTAVAGVMKGLAVAGLALQGLKGLAATLIELAKVIKTDGQSITDILNYVDGTEKNSIKIQGTVDTLVEIEKNTNPGISDKEAFKNVMELRQ